MKHPERSQTVSLADGRTLGFARYGSRSGTVVFHFHGSAGSRFERPADESILQDLGIHFISTDRPGHGISDPHPDRRLLDWPDDVRQLADHLGIDRCYVMGLSAGGPHALACAYKLRERTLACSVVSGLAPPDRPNPYQALPFAHRIIMFVFRNIPWLTYLMRRGMYSLAQGDLETLRKRLISGFPPADRELLNIPENTAMMIEEIKEGYRQGWAGPACDDIVINTPWGFHLKDIPVHVDIWHGELDQNIPVDHARYHREQIPNSRLTVWPGQAHLGLLSQWREVLAALVEQVPR